MNAPTVNTPRSKFIVAAAVCATVGVAATAAVFWSYMSHGPVPSTETHGDIAIVRLNDGYAVAVCFEGGVDRVAIREGVDAGPTAPLAWSAERLDGARSSQTLALEPTVAGYRVDAPRGIRDGRSYSVTSVRSPKGGLGGTTAKLGRLSLKAGEVRTGDGRTVSVAEFSAAHPGCDLSV